MVGQPKVKELGQSWRPRGVVAQARDLVGEGRRAILRMGIQARIGLLVALGLVGIFGLFGYLGLQGLNESTQRSLQERLLITQLVANHVDDHLQQTLRRLEAIAAQPSLAQGDLEPATSALRDFHLFSELFLDSVFILDKEGRVVWGDPASRAAAGASLSDYPTVRTTLQAGKPAISGVVFQALSGKALVLITVPIRGQGGKVIGAVGGAIEPTVSGLAGLLGPLRLGRTGYAEVVDDNGIVLASTKPERLFRKDDHADRFGQLIRSGKTTVATCHRCHLEGSSQRQQDVLAFSPLSAAPWGVAVRQLEEEALAPAQETRRRMILIALPLLVIALYIAWVTTRHVVRPIKALTAASQRIAAGDLNFAIQPSSQDEIGALAAAFNTMRAKLKASYEELEAWNKRLEERVAQRTKELSTLFEASQFVASTLDLDSLLKAAVARLVEMIEPADAGALFLYEESLDRLVVRSSFGYDAEALRRVRLRPGESISGRVFQSSQALLCATSQEVAAAMEDAAADNLAYLQKAAAGLGPTYSAMCVPLITKERVIGTLVLRNSRPTQPFTRAELSLVQAIADQLAVAVENARLYEEVQHKEMLRGQLLEKVITAQEEERKRIARELHDETGQSLTALAISLAAVEQALPPDAQPAQKSLGQAQALAEKLLAETRRLISDLRPTVLDDLGLVPALRRYAKTYSQMWQLDIQVDATGPRRRLSPQLETALFRIVQEAITNVAKHAQASTARVRLAIEDTTATVVVEDDGRGFDMEEVLRSEDHGRGLGLLGMQERATLFGGTFQVDSQPGRGTRLTVRVPLKLGEERDGQDSGDTGR